MAGGERIANKVSRPGPHGPAAAARIVESDPVNLVPLPNDPTAAAVAGCLRTLKGFWLPAVAGGAPRRACAGLGEIDDSFEALSVEPRP